MSTLRAALLFPRRELRWLLVLWLAQFAAAALIALPVFSAASPLLDRDFFQPGALMLSEVAMLEKKRALKESLGIAASSGLATFVLLGLFRFELTRRVARRVLAEYRNTIWWKGAAKYYGIGVVQGLGWALLGWVLLRVALRFYRDTTGTFPPQATLGALLTLLFLVAIWLTWNIACDFVRVRLFHQHSTIELGQFQFWFTLEGHQLFVRLFTLKFLRFFVLVVQTWLVLELTSPQGALVNLGAIGCGAVVQVLVAAGLWLDAAWLSYIGLSLNHRLQARAAVA